MESESTESTFASRFNDKLNEQEWFQELKQKWEEFDPRTRMAAQLSAVIGFAVAVIIVVTFSYWKVLTLKKEYQSKAELLNLIQAGNDEVRQLGSFRSQGADAEIDFSNQENFKSYLAKITLDVNLSEESIEIQDIKTGKSSDLFEETLAAIVLKNVNIKQMTKIAFEIENGSAPIRLRRLEMETRPDQSGYLSAKLFISAYKIK